MKRLARMRIYLAVAGICLSMAGGAWAQTAPSGVLTPAPVPDRGPVGVPPADRVERPNGAERAAPFSGLPSSVEGDRGESTPSTLGDSTRQGAPAPSLSK